jgi:hypothetical protein
MTGTLSLLILSFCLIGPALSWRATIENKALKSLWYDEDKKSLRPSAILWFILPLVGFGAVIFLVAAGQQWLDIFYHYVSFSLGLILILIITGLGSVPQLP